MEPTYSASESARRRTKGSHVEAELRAVPLPKGAWRASLEGPQRLHRTGHEHIALKAWPRGLLISTREALEEHLRSAALHLGVGGLDEFGSVEAVSATPVLRRLQTLD